MIELLNKRKEELIYAIRYIMSTVSKITQKHDLDQKQVNTKLTDKQSGSNQQNNRENKERRIAFKG